MTSTTEWAEADGALTRNFEFAKGFHRVWWRHSYEFRVANFRF